MDCSCDWTSLRYQATHQVENDTYAKSHTWRVYERASDSGGATSMARNALCCVQLQEQERAWCGLHVEVSVEERPDWLEIVRGVLESALDKSEWKKKVRTRLEVTQGGTPAEPSSRSFREIVAALRRLGLRWQRSRRRSTRTQPGEPKAKPRREGAWLLEPASGRRRPTVVERPGRGAEIAIGFSGGGLRATAFGLGAMWALNDLGLTEAVSSMSSVSGGSVLAAAWLRHVHLGENNTFEDFAGALFRFMVESPDHPPSEVHEPRQREVGLPGRYADLLARTLLAPSKPTAASDQLQYDVDAPDLTLGCVTNSQLETAFQITEMVRATSFVLGTHRVDSVSPGSAEGNLIRPSRAIWGSANVLELAPEAVSQIRLADVVAASAAFPVGFEPLVFPRDFILDREVERRFSEEIRKLLPAAAASSDAEQGSGQLPLIDGGAFDNQGIGLLRRAAERVSNRAIRMLLVVDADGHNEEVPILRPTRSALAKPRLRTFASSIRKLSRGQVLVATLAGALIAAGIGCFGLLLTGLAVTVVGTIAGAKKVVNVVHNSVPPALAPLQLLRPQHAIPALWTRIMLIKALLTSSFMRRVRRLNYSSLYKGRLPARVTIRQIGIRSLVHHGKAQTVNPPETREQRFARRYPLSERTYSDADRASQLSTSLRLGLDYEKRKDRANRAIRAGHASTLLGLLKVLHFTPQLRTAEARALLLEIDTRWRELWHTGGTPEQPTWAVAASNSSDLR